MVLVGFLVLLSFFYIKTSFALRQMSSPIVQGTLIAAIAAWTAYIVIAMLNTQVIQRFNWLVFAIGLLAASKVHYQTVTRPGTIGQPLSLPNETT